jgi:hypothetical protein
LEFPALWGVARCAEGSRWELGRWMNLRQTAAMAAARFGIPSAVGSGEVCGGVEVGAGKVDELEAG